MFKYENKEINIFICTDEYILSTLETLLYTNEEACLSLPKALSQWS